MKIVRVIAAILALTGLVLIAFGIGGYRSQVKFLDNASDAAGEVTKVTRHTRTSGSGKHRTTTYYTFDVKFRTPRGETIERPAMETSSSPRFLEGEKVQILFSREDPREFTIDDFAMLWADVVVLFVAGASLLAAGSAAFWIAGGKSARKVRNEAKLAELSRAWREGRLTRDSEFQGLLIAFALAGFPLLGGAILFALFADWVVQAIVGSILAFIAFQVLRARRRR